MSTQFKRLAARRGLKRAIVAVGHSLLTIVYTMMKTGKLYCELGEELEQLHKEQLQTYLIRRLQRLGLSVTVQPA